MTVFRRIPWICFLALVPALAGNQLCSVVQGVAPGTQIEEQVKGARPWSSKSRTGQVPPLLAN